MKKLIAFLVALTLLFVAGGSTKTSGNGEELDEWGITLSAKDVTATGMTLICTQSGGNPTGDLQTGSPFSVERFADGEWEDVPTVPGILDWVWTMEAWGIQPDTTAKWNVNWEFLYGTLAPGTYRIKKEIMDFRGPGDYTEKAYYAEFAVVD